MIMQKPVSPEDWDIATPRDRRLGKVPAERPTQEQYEAAQKEYATWMEQGAKRSAFIDRLEAAGGKYWTTEDGSKVRVYFDGIDDYRVSGYYDVLNEKWVGKHPDFESLIKARVGE